MAINAYCHIMSLLILLFAFIITLVPSCIALIVQKNKKEERKIYITCDEIRP
jgi:hypothetical protein